VIKIDTQFIIGLSVGFMSAGGASVLGAVLYMLFGKPEKQDRFAPTMALARYKNGTWYMEASVGSMLYTEPVRDEKIEEILMEHIMDNINPHTLNYNFDMTCPNGSEYTILIRKKTSLEDF
jgi:hypothetical protein